MAFSVRVAVDTVMAGRVKDSSSLEAALLSAAGELGGFCAVAVLQAETTNKSAAITVANF